MTGAAAEPQVPIEIVRANALATGRSVEQVLASLQVSALPESEPNEVRRLEAARRELGRQRARALERARAKDARKRESAQREAERRARFLAVSKRRGCSLQPNDVPRTVREIVWRTMRGEAAAQRALLRMKRSPFGAAVEVAALAMERQPDGTRKPTRSLRRRRARRVVAVAAVLQFLAQLTKSPGRALIAEGLPRGVLCSLFHNDDTGEAVSIGTLFATMLDGYRRGRWDCGAVVALVRAGAIEKVQPPAHTQRARFVGVGRDGRPRALNQYFLRTEVFEGEPESIEARALDAWNAWQLGARERAARRATRGPPSSPQL